MRRIRVLLADDHAREGTAIFQALGVSDRTQAALWAQRHRISG